MMKWLYPLLLTLPLLLNAACPSRCCDPNCEDDQCGAYIGADLLYWTACQKDLNLWNFEKDIGQTTFYDRKIADYDWAVGYRIFGGYRMGCDDFELGVIFTHWDNDATIVGDSIPASSQIAEYRGDNDLDYESLEILVGRSYKLGCDTTFSPHVGFRGVWLDQRLKITKTNNCKNVEWFEADLFARGLHAGSRVRFASCGDFAVWADIGASLLEADVTTRHDRFRPEQQDINVTLKENYCMPFPGYNLGCGIDYECCYTSCGHQTIFQLGVGYEFTHWFCTPEIIRNTYNIQGVNFNEPIFEPTNQSNDSSSGSLILHGLAFRVGILY